jgi:sulfate/thiosulfate transport system ATP-binding protein
MSIEVKHISKTFGNFVALRDVSLRVNDGELLALLGPSGSGKTTLLRIIAGLENPDSNPQSEILFQDTNVADRPVGKRRVGFVFQHYALFRHMSVFENIAFGLRVRPRAERPSGEFIKDRVSHLLKLIQLESFGHRYPSQLSGGQRQRVALARALAVEPKVLLLDEPFGALDAKVRQGLRDWLRKLHDEIHLTSVLVTHDQEEALEVADRIVVMNNSQIEQIGTPDEVFHQPATPFVMEFLGQVNVFHGRVNNGQILLGELPVGSLPGSVDREGVIEGAAKVYLRPHELDVGRVANQHPSLPARIERLNPAGSITRVHLQTLAGPKLQVELTVARYQELGLVEGELIHVFPKKAHVFATSTNHGSPQGSNEK